MVTFNLPPEVGKLRRTSKATLTSAIHDSFHHKNFPTCQTKHAEFNDNKCSAPIPTSFLVASHGGKRLYTRFLTSLGGWGP